jgi:hypothetical protein
MENIPEDEIDESPANRPKAMAHRPVSKIINNRHSNQIIYKMFLQKVCAKY